MRIRIKRPNYRLRKLDSNNEHRVEFPTLVKDIIRTSDVILEVLDARFIEETRNIELEEVIEESEKKIIYIVNKIDLVEREDVEKKLNELNLKPYVLVSCKDRNGVRALRERIKIEVKRAKIEKKTARVGIVGYPNTGKSSLINVLVGGGGSKTSAEAGFTRGIQKRKLTSDIHILDTPGVFLINENPELSSEDLKKHAKIGIQSYDKVKDPDFIIAELMKDDPGKFEKFYGVESEGDPELFLEEIGKKLNLKKKGGEIDIDRAARAVLKDWQKNKIK